MKILGIISLIFLSVQANAEESLVGMWSSSSGALCEASGESVRRLDTLTLEAGGTYARTIAFVVPGICIYSIKGTYTQQGSEILFSQSNGTHSCGGKPEEKTFEAFKVTYSRTADGELVTTTPNDSCGTVKIVYRPVK